MNTKKNILIILISSFFFKILISLFYEKTNFPDAQTYLTGGNQLFDNGMILIENIMPLYPILLFVAEKTIGGIMMNICLATLSIYIAYRISHLIFKDNFTSFIVAIWMAIYPFNYFYSYYTLTEITYVFLVLISFYYLYKYSYTKSCFFFVLTLLVKPNIEILVPSLIFFVSYFQHNKFIFSIKKLLIYFAIYIFLMSPWWYHQYKKYGYFVRTNFGSSLVLYSGNNPLNLSGGGVIITEEDVKKNPEKFDTILTDYSLESFQGQPGFKIISSEFPVYEGGKEAYLLRHKTLINASIDFIRDNPQKFFKLSVLKFQRFWSPIPFSKEFKSTFKILISLISLIPIYIFSLIGIFFILKNKIYRAIPILIFCIYINLIHIITISSFRYRFIIEMFLIIVASYGLRQVIKVLK
jgi:hypothetical protein